MKEPQSLFVNNVGIAPIRIDLLELQIPVAELVPPEVIELISRKVITMALESGIDLLSTLAEAACDPAIRQRHRLAGTLARLAEQQAGCVPDLVGEGFQRVDSIFAQRDI